MNDRYFGKIVSILDKFTVVIDKGSIDGVKINDKFLIVGLGEIIFDPITKKEIERLELVRGTAIITHVQSKISTMISCSFEKGADVKEITKVTSQGGGLMGTSGLFAPANTITESIKPGEQTRKPLTGVQIGDLLIKI